MNEEVMDRFALGELSAAESRALAQQALDDPELFDELTALSVARSGLATHRRKSIGGLSAAISAAVAAALLLVWTPAPRAPSFAPPTPAAPILLARNCAASPAVFRGDEGETESRLPQASGVVVSAEDGVVAIDLGSLDGLAKGGEVEVRHDGKLVGTLTLTTLFRDRARGKAAPGVTVHPGDRVLVPAAASLAALLDQIAAFSERGDSAGAQRIAGAVQLTVNSNATHYADLNNLGAIAELHGDKLRAHSFYRRALETKPPDAARQSIQSNLARLEGRK